MRPDRSKRANPSNPSHCNYDINAAILHAAYCVHVAPPILFPFLQPSYNPACKSGISVLCVQKYAFLSHRTNLKPENFIIAQSVLLDHGSYHPGVLVSIPNRCYRLVLFSEVSMPAFFCPTNLFFRGFSFLFPLG